MAEGWVDVNTTVRHSACLRNIPCCGGSGWAQITGKPAANKTEKINSQSQFKCSIEQEASLMIALILP